MLQYLEERSRESGLTKPELLRVYAATGIPAALCLGPDDLRWMADMIEISEEIDREVAEERARSRVGRGQAEGGRAIREEASPAPSIEDLPTAVYVVTLCVFVPLLSFAIVSFLTGS